MGLSWGTQAQDPVDILVVIPGGQSTSVGNITDGSTSINWQADIRSGTNIVFVAGDRDGLGSGGSTDVMSVGSGDSGCINGQSPSSTAGSPVGGVSTASGEQPIGSGGGSSGGASTDTNGGNPTQTNGGNPTGTQTPIPQNPTTSENGQPGTGSGDNPTGSGAGGGGTGTEGSNSPGNTGGPGNGQGVNPSGSSDIPGSGGGTVTGVPPNA